VPLCSFSPLSLLSVCVVYLHTMSMDLDMADDSSAAVPAPAGASAGAPAGYVLPAHAVASAADSAAADVAMGDKPSFPALSAKEMSVRDVMGESAIWREVDWLAGVDNSVITCFSLRFRVGASSIAESGSLRIGTHHSRKSGPRLLSTWLSTCNFKFE